MSAGSGTSLVHRRAFVAAPSWAHREHVVVVEAQDDDGAVVAVAGRACRGELDDRHDASALLAERLGDQLLDPQAEGLEPGGDAA